MSLVRDWKAEKKDLEEAFDIIADKLVIIADKLVKADAEIEGLKARVEALRQIREEDKALITELCDALAGMKPISSSSPVISELEKEKLIQRAREATR